jgi:DNA mismatch repair protein MutL
MTGSDQAEIQQLDAQTVERIAAGEVVERPASVVKELVENSIDADASRVTVAVQSGGIDGIRVTDDGVGMSEAALERAVEKHTTSKIGDIDDLESGVGTLGFRGEALHAIGAVSRLTITSRPRDGGPGTELTVDGGEITDKSPAGAPTGTTVEVRDLFYNVPARRKYLKQESTEFAHVNRVVTSYALANPDVAVTLEHDGRETFSTTGQGNLRETILSVYGRDVADGMVEVTVDDLPEGPLDAVGGLVSDPETNRATREYLSTFVNGRYVTAGAVRDAIVDAYGKQLAGDRYPFAVVFLDVDPATVDVNVHPRKLEVRFADEDGVREQVRTAVEETLLDAGLVRSSAPRGRSAPEQARIQPESTGNDDDSPGQGQTTPGSREQTESSESQTADSAPPGDDETTEPTESPTVSTRTVDAESYPDSGQSAQPAGADRASGTEQRDHEDTTTDPQEDRVSGAKQREGRSGTTEDGVTEGPHRTDSDSHATHTGRGDDGVAATEKPGGKFRDTGEQQRLGEDERGGQFETLPSMRVLGQFKDTYIVGETAEGLVLIDQHAADERINYERLRESLDGDTTTQALAEPVQVEVTAQEAALFSAHTDALAQLGFQAEQTGDHTLTVRTVPSLVAEAADPAFIREVLSELVTGEAAAAETVEAAADALLADLACYPSVTGNTSLTEGSVVDLLARLDECENPYACPHGRPVVIELDDEEIDARFERDYPGHQ